MVPMILARNFLIFSKRIRSINPIFIRDYYFKRRPLKNRILETIAEPENSTVTKNKLIGYLQLYNSEFSKIEEQLYFKKAADKNVPFNITRHLLDFPLSNHREFSNIQNTWMEYFSQYDINFIKQALIEMSLKQDESLRHFWIISIKLSLSSLDFYRDMLGLIQILCDEIKNNPKLISKYFNDDFYDCIIGFYFLNRKSLLVKAAHDVIYPVLKSQDSMKLVKCCCVPSNKNSEDFTESFNSLLYIKKPLTGSYNKVGDGIYDSLISFLNTRLLTAEQILVNESQTDQERYCSLPSTGTSENSVGSVSLELTLAMLDIHIRLLRNRDIPKNPTLLNKLIGRMVQICVASGRDSLIANNSGSHDTLIKGLRKTFNYLVMDETNVMMLYNNDLQVYENRSSTSWWTQRFVNLMVDYCFLDSRTYSAESRLVSLLKVIPKYYYFENVKFWEHLYHKCSETRGTVLRFISADKLFFKYGVGKKLTDKENITSELSFDTFSKYVLHHGQYYKLIEYKCKTYQNTKYFSAILNPIIDHFLKDGGEGRAKLVETLSYLGNSEYRMILSPRIMGYCISALCEQGDYDSILDIIKIFLEDLGKAQNSRDELGLIDSKLISNYVDEIAKFYVIGVTKSWMATLSEEELTSINLQPQTVFHDANSMHLLKKLMDILNSTESFQVGKFPKVQNTLTHFFLKSNDFERTLKLVKLLVENDPQNGLEKETLMQCSKKISNRMFRSNRLPEGPHKELHDIVVDYVNNMHNVLSIDMENWSKLYSTLAFVQTNYHQVGNYLFWVINKVLYSYAYENGTPIKLSDEDEKIFKKIQLMNEIDQLELHKDILPQAFKALKSLESTEVCYKGKTLFNTSQQLIDEFYSTIQDFFTPGIICRLIDLGVEKSPHKPFEGLELIMLLKDLQFIRGSTLQKSKTKIESTIIRSLKNLYTQRQNRMHIRWSQARASKQLLSESVAQENYKAMTEGYKPPEIQLYEREEVAEIFSIMMEKLFTENLKD
ncbi:hypothetical protein DASC09_061080 [Saccharomycopsis crataegensis]|uniref:Uncharacterized protein n=1 Tax=Saccharomycopsis crataegensis TaxID=43959 RepID=A0AAV5QVP2_9ASCO|nr:hypothetical protein DASC09_061080 [Saccharomycopsis crataegensis]